MTYTEAKKVKKEYKALKLRSKLLTMKSTLFMLRVKTYIFCCEIPKHLTKVILLLPTITYNSIYTCPFDRYYDFAKGNNKRLIRFGFNLNKAQKSFVKISRERIDLFGINDELKKMMLREAEIVLAEAQAIKEPKKTSRYLRMVDDFKPIKQTELSLTDIVCSIGNYFKDKDVDLSKMSVYSVLKCFQIMQHGNKE